MRKKILIVGSGVVGLNTAVQLINHHGGGIDVKIVEQYSDVAQVSSFANGGQVSVCNSAAWNTWGNISKGVRWMMDQSAPLRISGKFSVDKAKWLQEFVAEIKNEGENTQEMFHIASASRELYKDFFNSGAIEMESLMYGGIYKFYRSEKTFNKGVTECVRFMNWGERSTVLKTVNGGGAGEYAEILANLRISDISTKIIGGVWYPDDFSFNLYEYCIKVKQYLISKGVTFQFNTHVQQNTEEYDLVIFCTGVGVGATAKNHGVENFPIVYPVKGYSITYNLGDRELFRTSVLDEDLKVVATPFRYQGSNMLRVAGTAELDGYNYDFNHSHPRIQLLKNWAEQNLDVDKGAEFVPYSCLRPMTPNMLPFIRRLSKNVVVHGGHGHLGQTLSMETARWVCNLI